MSSDQQSCPRCHAIGDWYMYSIEGDADEYMEVDLWMKQGLPHGFYQCGMCMNEWEEEYAE